MKTKCRLVSVPTPLQLTRARFAAATGDLCGWKPVMFISRVGIARCQGANRLNLRVLCTFLCMFASLTHECAGHWAQVGQDSRKEVVACTYRPFGDVGHGLGVVSVGVEF